MKTIGSGGLKSIILPSLCRARFAASSKKKVLEGISSIVSTELSELDEDAVYEALASRERLGSTGIGNGIAIPHCRTENCRAPVGVLFTLESSINFDAMDNQPVDLVFALLVPIEATSEHLTLLAELAQRFSDPEFCQELRQCEDDRSLFNRLLVA